MESYSYTQFPALFSNVHIALFTNVQNATELRARIVKASMTAGVAGDNERAAVNFAFIAAKLVTSRQHLQTAIYQSLIAQTQNALKTRTVHSEILWSLNPSSNITEALRRFGVSDTSDALLVVHVGPPSEARDIEAQMRAAVNGELTPISAIADITDWTSVKKHYKLNGDPVVSAFAQDPVGQRIAIDELVVSFVAMKSVMS